MSILDMEDELLASVKENLPDSLSLTTKRMRNADYDGEAVLSVDNHRTFTFKMEMKIIRRKENLFLLRNASHITTTEQRLLICSPLTPAQIKICEELKLNFIDAAGNASINIDGLFLQISGRKAPKTAKKLEGVVQDSAKVC